MSTNSHLPGIFNVSIIHKTYEFYLLLHAAVTSFQKIERYTLGQRCENLALDLLILLLRANQTKNFNRKNMLLEASSVLDLLRILIRATKDVCAISEKKYLELQARLQEIGKMLGGWIKIS